MGIDSSGLVASVAVVDEDSLLAEYTVNYKKTHSQTLLPMLDAVMGMLGVDIQSIDAIAVAAGPGSFTGLRIGAATAKGLGLALRKPLARIPTVDALAYNLCGSAGLVCPLMDARRSQAYTGLYSFSGARMEAVEPQHAAGIGEIIDGINARAVPVTFLGDGAPVFQEYIKEHCLVPYSFAPAHLSRQRASSVATLALGYCRRGETVDAAAFKPEYLRPSQAERQRVEAGKDGGNAGET